MNPTAARSFAVIGLCSLALCAQATAPVAPPLPDNYMLGTWTLATPDKATDLIFLANGTYAHIQTGPNEGGGHPGFEIGTYTFSALSGSLVRVNFDTQLDTNGAWGAHIPGESTPTTYEFSTYQAPGMKCILATNSGESICSPTTSGNSLVGGWYTGTGFGNIGLLVFLADGSYMQAIDPPDPSFETGNFSFDVATGALTVSNAHRYGGTDLTLSQMGGIHASITGGQLSLAGTAGDLAYGSVPASPVPEPGTAALLLLGLLGVGSARRRAPAMLQD